MKWKKKLSENDTFAYPKRFNCHDFSRFCMVVIVSGDSPLNGAAVKTDQLHIHFSKSAAEGRRDSEVRVMPVLETPALKNPFCRRSGRDKRSGRERRMSVDFTKYRVDRRSGVDRRKVQDRRKHDYWNTNYRYWNAAV